MINCLRLENDLNELEKLNSWVESIAAVCNLTRKKAFSLRLVLEEIVTNVMKYAYGDGVDATVEIICCCMDDRLQLQVEDLGPVFNPLEVPDPPCGQELEEAEEGGLGILLVRSMMDEVNYKRLEEKNVLTMAMNL